jgi:hypothetical protein
MAAFNCGILFVFQNAVIFSCAEYTLFENRHKFLTDIVWTDNVYIIEWHGKIIMKLEYVRVSKNILIMELKELLGYLPKTLVKNLRTVQISGSESQTPRHERLS